MEDGDGAGTDARRAAQRAGVTVRAVTEVADLRAVAGLFALAWESPAVPPLPHDVMRSLVHAGGAVHAAFRDGRLTGAAVATFGPPPSASCYSLITGVHPQAERRGTGLALKLAQRQWALAAGAASMTWTFDPLLRRNARFNLTRLGAAVTEYLTDFYGEIPDGVNDPETDRLAVTWDLRAPLPAPPGTDGTPGTARDPGPAEARCPVPEDIMAIRRSAPGLARQWRLAVREQLGGALAAGYRVSGFADPGGYLLARDHGDREGS